MSHEIADAGVRASMPSHGPNPPRYKWLKRLTLAYCLLFAAIGGLRAWWGYEAQRRIDNFIASAHARGEPILPEDFKSPAVPDADNAAIFFVKAVQEFERTMTAVELNFDPTRPPNYTAAELQVIEAMGKNHSLTLQLIRQGRGCHHLDWKKMSAPLGSGYGTLNSDTEIIQLLEFMAWYEHSISNDDEAMEDLRDALTFAEANARKTPSVMAAGAMREMVLITKTIEDISPLLNVPADTESELRRQVQALINELLDDRGCQQACVVAYAGDAMRICKPQPAIEKPHYPLPLVVELLSPAISVAREHSAGEFLQIASAYKQENYPLVLMHIILPIGAKSHSCFDLLESKGSYFYSGRRGAQMMFGALGERRAMAIKLSIRLYQSDHAGKLPESLEELTPRYLPYVPHDPFSGTNQAFRYLPRRNPPAIYSVGTNGTDEGGSERQMDYRRDDRWNQEDAVFSLADVAATQPSTVPAQ